MGSAPLLTVLCALSSSTVRLGSYLFLRWIPGHVFPTVIFTAYGIYASLFAILYLGKPSYEIVASSSRISILRPADHDAETTSKQIRTDGGATEDKPTAIEATETTVYRKRQPHPLKHLLWGTPSVSGKLSLATFAINTLLAIATWDLTFRTTYFYTSNDLSFARVGHVGPDSAKLLLREPDPTHYPLSVWYSHDKLPTIDLRLVDTIPGPSEETDFTKTLTLHHLTPETRYRWYTSSNHSGTFTTAPRENEVPSGGGFTFLTTSCIKANFPYDLTRHPLAVKGFRDLSAWVERLEARFMLFLGDFIYIDVPRRPGFDKESYRQQYRQIYASPDWPSVGANLPWIHVIDDHEISNDWSSNTTGVYPAAMDPFNIYQHSVNPPPVRPAGDPYYTFDYGSAASFFMLDTRTYRSPVHLPDGPEKTMLGERQKADLLRWLSQGSGWKIIASSVPFTKNWRVNGRDTWGGYLHERQELLEQMWEIGGGRVIILSGDRHEFAATAFPPPPDSGYSIASTVHEFSCSPLNQFFVPIRTYKQLDNEDLLIKYVPDGNRKFGAITVDTTNKEQDVLKYRLVVDGNEKWSWVLTAPRVAEERFRKEKGNGK
ncbi:Metallo-dependent phosphatase [Tuber magnatum]|uniref:Metallo-dependent phosphatase n=1 Tax=Tuber magnatum TaxID=42249 RepID=A0A317SSE6_9PEZI|nr:Metallo-dependent phosphatase [Tuber magnatum]